MSGKKKTLPIGRVKGEPKFTDLMFGGISTGSYLMGPHFTRRCMAGFAIREGIEPSPAFVVDMVAN